MSDLPEYVLSVDRSRALVRGFYRAFAAVFLGGAVRICVAAWIGTSPMRWELLWENERAFFVALVSILACLGLAVAVCGILSARWFALAAWPARLHVSITSESVRLQLGPFGSNAYSWHGMSLRTLEDIDPEILASIPDELLTLEMRHTECQEDLAVVIQRFAGVDAEDLNRLLRPYLMRWVEHANGDRA